LSSWEYLDYKLLVIGRVISPVYSCADAVNNDNIFNHTEFRIYDPDNPGSSGNNIISCYAGPVYSAGFQAKGGADCVTGASLLHPLNAHRPRTVQFGVKLSF